MWDHRWEKMFWTNSGELVTLVPVARAPYLTGFLSLFTIKLQHVSEYTHAELFMDTNWDIDRFCLFLCFQHISSTLVMFFNQVVQLDVSEQFQHSISDSTTFFLGSVLLGSKMRSLALAS